VKGTGRGRRGQFRALTNAARPAGKKPLTIADAEAAIYANLCMMRLVEWIMIEDDEGCILGSRNKMMEEYYSTSAPARACKTGRSRVPPRVAHAPPFRFSRGRRSHATVRFVLITDVTRRPVSGRAVSPRPPEQAGGLPEISRWLSEAWRATPPVMNKKTNASRRDARKSWYASLASLRDAVFILDCNRDYYN
jgi:hypothetical protein